ncbi:MAG: T9SS type A sorting domain-containing protein [bacterium]|nr:MAG: T9SS type A sorting domain-containing protein [bacterium]
MPPIPLNRQLLWPWRFILHQNYPNPFNPTTTIKFELPEVSRVKLKIFNFLGEKVFTLLSESLPSGSHWVEWIASNFASGIYLYQ